MSLSSSNRKYPPFPLFSYFSVVVCLRCLLHHILSLFVYTFWENREFVFIIIVQFMMSTNSRIRFGLQLVSVCLYNTPYYYHHCANFIWRHWTYKIPVRCNLSSVWARLSIFSQLSIIQYVGLCVFNLPISFVMIERIYILCLIIIIKSAVWTITHCLWFGHETMVCAVCLSIFLFLLYFSHITAIRVNQIRARNLSTVHSTKQPALSWSEQGVQLLPYFLPDPPTRFMVESWIKT